MITCMFYSCDSVCNMATGIEPTVLLPHNDAICKDEFGYSKFVEPKHQHVCGSQEHKNAMKNTTDTIGCCQVQTKWHGKEKEPQHLLQEARKSFMSGHSSFSFYCATFLVIYLHARLANDHAKDAKLTNDGAAKIYRAALRYILFGIGLRA